ncbi:organic cation transporter protein-like [Ruditapes philippinarum]|uniref:organic cation transporter protein-like n=1 Tax=Ruditapes philippinarum TaxID=129788 RepID=UPI00295B3732|nr:organic cation transporter protein-like [Ruditapes philippinarum]
MTSFDDILKEIGEFGPYQKRVYAMLCLPSFILSALLVVQVFLLGTPNHRCKLPEYANDSFEIQGPTHERYIQGWIPLSDGDKYDNCHIFIHNHTADSFAEKITCSEWVYDESVYKHTFSKQLNLVCDDAIKVPNAQMIFFFGVLSGSLVYGQLSDIIGRRKALYISIVIQLGSSLGLIGMTEYIGFCILMFVLGGATLGVYMTSYVLGMELVGPSKRLWTGTVAPLFLTTGQLYLILMVYLIRDWKYFTLAVAIPGCLFLPYYWLIPESCRWLLSKSRNEEALLILRKVAKSNKTVLNENKINELTSHHKEGRVWQLFSTRTLGCWSLIIFFNWFVCSMSYYGVVLNTSNLGGDIFLNFVLLTIVEYPGKILDVLLLDRIGRKKLYVAYLFVGGLAFIATIWPIIDGNDGLHFVLIALTMVGKLCITGAFGAVYVLSAEIYPTVIRNTGMGSSSAVARVGSMIAPYIAKSADLVNGVTGKAIPLTLFGASMFIAALLSLSLPETLNRELPEIIPDVENLKRKKVEVNVTLKSLTTINNSEVTNEGFSGIEANDQM